MSIRSPDGNARVAGRLTAPLWAPAAPRRPRHAPLRESVSADVVVVGGGITGLSAALELAEAGKRVVLLEARTLGVGTTGCTTGHVVEALDARYARIEADFGARAARRVAESCRDGIDRIARRIERYAISCAFERLPGYLFTERADDADDLAAEHAAAARAGCRVSPVAVMSLPFAVSGVRFEAQAQLDVGAYLRGVEDAAIALGVRIFEQSRVVSIDEASTCTVRLENEASVRGDFVLLATHAPLNRAFLQSKLVHYQSYVAAVRHEGIERALFWDTASPYHYLRNAAPVGARYVVVGGEDHRTGTHESTRAHAERLMSYVRPRFGDVGAAFFWSARLIESVDGLPYIGLNSSSDRVFVATGFGGNGLTFGTLAAAMFGDFVRGEPNAYADLYAPARVDAHRRGALVESGFEAASHAVIDRVDSLQEISLGVLALDQGRVLRVNGRRLAVYRDPAGELHAVPAACAHLGCVVGFNDLERSWDCPCHGSRFGIDGAVLEGPAVRPLNEPGPQLVSVGPAPEMAPRASVR